MWELVALLSTIALAISVWAPWFLHNRVFPYRNQIVRDHMEHGLQPLLASRKGSSESLKVLDFGCGGGDTSKTLRDIFGEQAQITCVDVYHSDRRWVADDQTVRMVYDGITLPFADKSFDLAVAGQVLHHVEDNKASLMELQRVAPHILIVEDLILPGTWQEVFCHLWDSFWNNDWLLNPPHSNRSESGWQELFTTAGLTVLHNHYTSFAVAKDMKASSPNEIADLWLQNAVYLLQAKS